MCCQDEYLDERIPIIIVVFSSSCCKIIMKSELEKWTNFENNKPLCNREIEQVEGVSFAFNVGAYFSGSSAYFPTFPNGACKFEASKEEFILNISHKAIERESVCLFQLG